MSISFGDHVKVGTNWYLVVRKYGLDGEHIIGCIGPGRPSVFPVPVTSIEGSKTIQYTALHKFHKNYLMVYIDYEGVGYVSCQLEGGLGNAPPIYYKSTVSRSFKDTIVITQDKPIGYCCQLERYTVIARAPISSFIKDGYFMWGMVVTYVTEQLNNFYSNRESMLESRKCISFKDYLNTFIGDFEILDPDVLSNEEIYFIPQLL